MKTWVLQRLSKNTALLSWGMYSLFLQDRFLGFCQQKKAAPFWWVAIVIVSYLLLDLVDTQEMYCTCHIVQCIPNTGSSGCPPLPSIFILTSMARPTSLLYINITKWEPDNSLRAIMCPKLKDIQAKFFVNSAAFWV